MASPNPDQALLNVFEPREPSPERARTLVVGKDDVLMPRYMPDAENRWGSMMPANIHERASQILAQREFAATADAVMHMMKAMQTTDGERRLLKARDRIRRKLEAKRLKQQQEALAACQ